MSIDVLAAHYGFSRTPFGRDLAPNMLHRSTGHKEAVARIAWCISERALGVITGEVGSGKTVATRAATAALDASRHSIIYLPNPAIGARGLYAAIVTALGGVPRFHKASLIPQAADALAAEEHERGKRVVVVVDLCRPRNYADSHGRRSQRAVVMAGSATRNLVWLSA